MYSLDYFVDWKKKVVFFFWINIVANVLVSGPQIQDIFWIKRASLKIGQNFSLPPPTRIIKMGQNDKYWFFWLNWQTAFLWLKNLSYGFYFILKEEETVLLS